MDILIGLIIISVAVAVLFLGVFVWNLKSGQFDDLVTPGIRILFEDTHVKKASSDSAEENKSDKDHNVS